MTNGPNHIAFSLYFGPNQVVFIIQHKYANNETLIKISLSLYVYKELKTHFFFVSLHHENCSSLINCYYLD